jgi:hypothetical protein
VEKRLAELAEKRAQYNASRDRTEEQEDDKRERFKNGDEEGTE